MKKPYLLILAAALIAAAAAALFLPGGGLALEEGPVQIRSDAGGTLSLTWPAAAAEEAEYLLSVRPGGGSWSEPERLSEPSAMLEDVQPPFQARIQAVKPGDGPGKWRLSIDVDAAALEAPELTGTVADNLVSLSWTGGGGGVYQICAQADGAPLAEVEAQSLDLRFGPGEALELPGENQPLQLTVRAGVKGRHYVFYGPPSAPYTVRRGALMDSPLSLTCQETESRKYVLSWSETRGSSYEVQEQRDGEWHTLARQQAGEPFRYETERLASGSYHRFRVTACDSGAVLDSQELEFYASVDPLYATVWPILDLNLCKTPAPGSVVRKIPAGTALCVLEEQPGWFKVRYLNDYGYVDSRFCMINLAEYIGDYCAYDITNSYSSIFKVHTSPIAQITGQVVPGFEHIQTASGFLVPYLYPCAQKLLIAAKAVIEDGYRLRIYEAFRPNQATRFLYDTTAAQLNYAVPVERGGYWTDPQLNTRVDLATGLYTDPATGKQVPRASLLPEPEPEPEPEETLPEEDTPGTDQDSPEAYGDAAQPLDGDGETGEPQAPEPPEDTSASGGPAPLPEAPEASPEENAPPEDTSDAGAPEGFLQDLLVVNANADQVPAPAAQSLPTFDTYGKIMTDNGRFSLGSFLARVTSAHNRGIALDLTLETLEEGTLLEMQSAMHDLSWYSAVYRNNDNAKLLEKYMTATGMRGLSSEWWHFQDDETREAIGLNTYLYKGVDASGWTRDDHGWRWRDAAGVPQKNTVITVDGTRWTLDAGGYVVE